jgi:RND superfamily putative drug exporter
MIILTFTFGTVTAMLLPIITAIFGLLATLSIIRMLEHVVTVPTVAPTLATMIGLRVGIDYALFIVTRHFRGMHEGLSIDESIARAATTSGGAVFFAGCTVTIALISLAVPGIPLVTTMGFMAAVAVVVAVLDATSVRCLLVPALMLMVGDNNWYMPKWLDQIVPHISIEGAEFFADRDKAAPAPPHSEPEPEPTGAAT